MALTDRRRGAVTPAAGEGARAPWVVVGGAGFIGRTLCRLLGERGEPASVIDIVAAPPATAAAWLRRDLLVEDVDLPPGRVVLSFGASLPRPVRPWTLALDNALATARLARHLDGRDVTVLSTIEVYGWARGPLRENTAPRLPVADGHLAAWVDRALATAELPCPPHRVSALCRELADLDPSGRWVYALSKLAQEQVVRRTVSADRLTILRLANVIGPAQFRVVGRLVEAASQGRPCRVTDAVRSFVSVDEVSRIVAALLEPGTYNVSSGTLPLAEVARIVTDELGCPRRICVTTGPAVDSCGVVDAGRLRAAIGPLEHRSGSPASATPVIVACRTPTSRSCSAHWARCGAWR
jgi:nucleoside-diphosphate-sugar epimerase